MNHEVMRRFLRVVLGLLVVLFGVMVARPAAAHTGLDSTTPADGEVVADPVDEIVLTFTEAVTPVGSGFEVFLPDLTTVAPEPSTEDGVSYVLSFDPPITGGAVGVRFSITSADGHVVDGAFAFEVTAPAPTSVPETTTPATPTPVTTIPATVPPSVETSPESAPAQTSLVTTTTETSPAPGTPVTESEGGGSELAIGIVVGVVIVIAGAVVVGLRRRSS